MGALGYLTGKKIGIEMGRLTYAYFDGEHRWSAELRWEQTMSGQSSRSCTLGGTPVGGVLDVPESSKRAIGEGYHN